ncbi:MAG: hypothetical protein M1274_03420 [Actinobacteria bacterium]|nr:hypothetical protein [Actinomycetota bacterium]
MNSAAAIVPIVIVLLIIVVTLAARHRGYGVGGRNTIVRCLEGHLFTTLWIPGISLKAIRFGPLRVQRCQVGDHLSIVTPGEKVGSQRC